MSHKSNIRLSSLIPAFMASFLVAALAIADPGEPEGDEAPKGKAARPTADKPKPDFPPFDEVMKDYTEVPTAESPFFPLWYNKKTDSLRAQIPASLIGQKFLVATSMAGGPIATGFQIDHFLAYFDRMDKSLVLMRVDPRYVEGSGDQPLSDVIKRSYGGDDILRTVSIVTMKDGDSIIDLDGLFKADFAGIGEWGLGTVNSQLSKWAKYKAFPQNVELTVDLALMRSGRGGGGSGRRNLFHYSISKIPESSQAYKPRLADDRIGYFMTVRKDWTKEHNARTLFNRYINRWHLEKRDPTAKLSAPKNPIIWYIEKTVPLKYRRWVKEGILEWNKGFEKCGFLDAIEVKQQEDYDRETKDLDPEDVRYNFFRWIVTGVGFAMGPSRDHPLTGQIFDADIVFDDSMVRFYVSDYAQFTGGEESWTPYDPIVESFFNAHPEWRYRSPWQNLLPAVTLRDDPDAEFRRNLMKHMYRNGRPMCECASGMAKQVQFARVALEAQGLGRDNEEFIGQLIKEIVMHEVGHCLGLRHNFKASTWLPMKEIEDHDLPGDASVGSVMDYNPPIISPRGQKQGSFTTRSIGPYDYWAIEYGYRPVGAGDKGEDEMLASIATRCSEAGLDYATDEDTMWFLSPDPYSNRFDMGRDITDYAERQVKLADGLLADIQKWAIKDGQSYTRLRNAFRRILAERANVTEYVARFVGGQVLRRDHRGDPDERAPIEVVSAAKQREAMKFVCDYVFSEDAYRIDPKLLAHLAPGRFWHWDSDDFDFRVDFNIHDFVSSAQYYCLLTLMNPFTIGRIHDNQVKFDDDEEVYTLYEHLSGLNDAIWSELADNDREGSEKKPFVNSFRRNLQRTHLNMMLNLVLSQPGRIVPADAAAISRLCVDRLSKKIDKTMKEREVDATTLAHLTDVKKRIDKALDAEYSLNSGVSGGGFIGFMRPTGTPDTDACPETVPVLPER
ncbi:MAG TPA: zinc-dependent metalloprotease [Phycisphaerae bacterium]|nr:zinc-dependent metalloprotease [Phycisphaerae bacterium]